MKHIKTFENLNKPQLGDYACLDLKYFSKKVLCNNNENIINFLNTHICKIIKTAHPDYGVEFEKNIPNDDNIAFIQLQDIEHFSDNKEYIENIINAKKYNL